MKKRNKFTLRISDEHLQKLTEIAMAEKRTVSAVIRNLIDEKKESVKIKKKQS